MPTYVYRCKKCKHRFEVFHSITDEAPRRCPKCKGKAERVPAGGGGGILFKGSGFYITDYRSKAYKDKAKSEKSGGGGSGGGSGGGEGGGSGGGEGGGKGGGKSPGSGGSSGGTGSGGATGGGGRAAGA